MRHQYFFGLFILLTILISPYFIHSDSHYEYIHSPKTDVYFGHISYTEVRHDGKDPVVVREGEEEGEVAVLNLPLAPGDIIKTTDSRRCEIQFDTGTILRLDLNTELKIETVLAQSLSSRKKITNLVLSKGQVYIMYAKYNSREVFQIVTPNAAAKMNHRTVALIHAKKDGSTDVQVKRGKIHLIYGPDEDHIHRKKIRKSQKATISKAHRIVFGPYEEDLDFGLWNEKINENFLELHKGKSFLPRPLEKYYPKAVFHFAQKYSNLYGQWIWNSLYGYVWRPYYNDYYPWGEWRPFFYGKWREVDGQLFWVPEETWGWVPYHLGLWMWDKKSGWIWIPGSAFAPAWAFWDFYGGYHLWRPWSLADWLSMWNWHYGYDLFFMYSSFRWQNLSRYDDFDYSFRGYDVPEGEEGRKVRSIQKISKRKEGRKIIRRIQKEEVRENAPYPMPSKLEDAYKRFVSSLEEGDQRILESLLRVPEQMVVVRSRDLNAPKIQERGIEFKQFFEQIKSSHSQEESLPPTLDEDPYEKALRTFKRNHVLFTLKRSLFSEQPGGTGKDASGRKKKLSSESAKKELKGEAVRQKFSPPEKGTLFPVKGPLRSSTSDFTMRFRDWNPDFKAARKAGVSIRYSSRTNEIRCPKLGLSSRNVRVGKGFSSGGFHSSRGFSSSSSSSSSGSFAGSSRGGMSGTGSKGGSGGSGKKK